MASTKRGKNAGIEIPKNENAVKRLSRSEYWRTAEIVPINMAMSSEKSRPVVINRTVFGRREPMMLLTG